MKPPISYYGGKQKMLQYLMPLIPTHDVYIEPFTGGGALFFAKELAKVNVLNDLNGNLVNFYRVLNDDTKAGQLIQMLTSTPYSHSEYKRACKIYKGVEQADDITTAWATYLACNWAFAKTPAAGWGFSVKCGTGPSNFQNKLRRLAQQHEKIKNTYIECIDAIDLIKKWDSPNSFFYCDPPYPETEQSGYSDKYTINDFNNLIEALDSIKGGFMLSCYDYEWIKVPPSWVKHTFNTKCSAVHRKNTDANRARTEAVWCGGNLINNQLALF